jgi:hypothetical protein
MMNGLCATVYRRLEINYFSRDNFLQVLAVTFICWIIIMYYRLYRFLPRILIVAHSTLQKRVSSYSALQLQCQLLVNHLCTKNFFFKRMYSYIRNLAYIHL